MNNLPVWARIDLRWPIRDRMAAQSAGRVSTVVHTHIVLLESGIVLRTIDPRAKPRMLGLYNQRAQKEAQYVITPNLAQYAYMVYFKTNILTVLLYDFTEHSRT